MSFSKLMLLGAMGGRGAAPFPSAEVAATIKLWWDFADTTTLFKDTARTIPVASEKDVIKGIADKSGLGNHGAENTIPPRFRTLVKNRHSMGEFGSGATATSLTATGFTINQPDTIYIVVSVQGGGPTFRNIIDALTSRQLVNIVTATGIPGYYAGTVVNGVTNIGSDFVLISATFNGANSALYKNDVLQANGNPGANASTGGMFLGGSGAGYLGGFVGDVIVASAPSQEIYNYLYSKWTLATAVRDTYTIGDEAGISNAVGERVYMDAGNIFFDGIIGATGPVINALTAGMIAKFNGNNITVIAKTKVAAGTWANNTQRDLFRFDGDTVAPVQIIAIDKPINTQTLRAFYQQGNNAFRTVTTGDLSTGYDDYFTAGIKIDAANDVFKFFLNGVDQGAYVGTSPIIAEWRSPLSAAEIGYTNNQAGTPGYNWWGWMADVILSYGVTASDADMATLNTKMLAGTLAASDLNTIFGAGNWSWWRNTII